MERRLKAILAADVVGYSHLVQKDEEATLLRFRTLFEEVVEPSVDAHGGRIVKTMGDGFLVEFASATEAVHCSIEIQEQFNARNEPYFDDNRMDLRIGVNVGDIIIDAGDVLGDGVNVAARLEGEAQPAGIYISGTAYDQVKLTFSDRCRFIGELKLKNISEPVRAYEILPAARASNQLRRSNKGGWVRVSSILAVTGLMVLVAATMLWSWNHFEAETGEEPANSVGKIAVLPFKNMSNDPEYQFFADGLSQDLITDLSKVSGIPVVSSRSSFVYRDTDLLHRDIARKLDARYIVEGSVRRHEQILRISASLVDMASDSQIWADRYDGQREDVFAFQDQITANIIRELRVILSPSQKRIIASHGTRNEDAYDAFLRGMRFLVSRQFLNVDGNQKAVKSFKEALRLDPDYPQAYAGLAWADWLHFSTINYFSYARREAAFKNAELSLSLGETALARRVLSRKYFSPYRYIDTTDEPERAARELDAALAIEPNNPDLLADIADVLPFLGETSRALATIKKAIVLNPDHPNWYLRPLGMAQLLNGEYEHSARSFRTWLKDESSLSEYRLWLISAEALAGRKDEAKELMTSLRKAIAINIPSTVEAVKRAWPLAGDEQELFLRGLRIAGISEG